MLTAHLSFHAITQPIRDTVNNLIVLMLARHYLRPCWLQVGLTPLPLAIVLAACSPTTYSVTVNALSSAHADGKTRYVLLPGNSGTTPDNLEFQEFAEALEGELQHNRFQRASDLASADIVILLAYGVGAPQVHHEQQAVPIIGQTGTAGTVTNGSVTTTGNTTTYTGYTENIPRYGITGWATFTNTYTTYDRYAMIVAYDRAASDAAQRPIELWETTVINTARNADLRRSFSLLMFVAARYFAKRTHGEVQVILNGRNNQVSRALSEPN